MSIDLIRRLREEAEMTFEDGDKRLAELLVDAANAISSGNNDGLPLWADVQQMYPHAALSSANVLLRHYERRKCDDPAVSGCIRCNAVFLAKWALDVVNAKQPATASSN